ncbi:MAG: FHA domain-containing protein, partial [Myxococcota bacterium]
MSTEHQKRQGAVGLVARLVYSEGSTSERIFRLNPNEPEVLVGRDRSCLIRTTRRNVSRRHCAIRWSGEEYEVRDLESANGTFVNGREVSSQVLADGDEIRCGLDFRIWFFLGSAEDRVTRAHVFLNFDKPLLERVEDRISVGRAFAFIPAQLFSKAKMPWVDTLFGAVASKPRVLPLLGPHPIELPGVRVRPMVPPAFRLVSVTCDRGIYQVGGGPVRVFVFDPLNPSRRLVLAIAHGEEEFTRRSVALDDNGCGLMELLNLPVGAYRVQVDGMDVPTASCRFMVAEYRLAPMVVYIDALTWSESYVEAGLWVESFGEPLSGMLRVDFQNEDEVLERQKVLARGGRARVRMEVDGEGPYALVVRFEGDTSKKASVQLVGHQRAEREETLFSGLGVEVFGALTPMEEARELRGVYVRGGAMRSSPFHLIEVAQGRVKLRSLVMAEALCVAVTDPTCPRIKPERMLTAEVSHPGLTDASYQEAELLYQEGHFAQAREIFTTSRRLRLHPHPYHAYYIACCCAREGDYEGALRALRCAIDDGWSDAEQLSEDEDLAPLRGELGFESLLHHGQAITTWEGVEPGQELELELPGPLA